MTDWQHLLAEVPRADFIPDDIWDAQLRPISRRTNPAEWEKLVADNSFVITQVNNGEGGEPRFASSSCSMPSVVAEMLDALDLQPDHHVLEIGTGTGWNAALLSRRAASVVSVEVDPAIAEQARQNLERTGHDVTVVTGDGLQGFAERSPYDRVISTAAVREVVPPAWFEQTKAGGVLVTPWGTDWLNGVLLTLRVDPTRAVADGRFSGDIAFMRIRSQRATLFSWQPSEAEIADADVSKSQSHGGDFDRIFNPRRGGFALGARLQSMYAWIDWDAEGERRHVVELDDGATKSFARVHADLTSSKPWTVRQLGPRRLWDEVEAAYDWWHDNGEPGMDRFGMSCTPFTQWLWLDTDENIVRELTRFDPQSKRG